MEDVEFYHCCLLSMLVLNGGEQGDSPLQSYLFFCRGLEREAWFEVVEVYVKLLEVVGVDYVYTGTVADVDSTHLFIFHNHLYH